MTTPRAFYITPLTVNAPSGSMRGPRTPFSPERERTFVTPPDVNPKRHAHLDGAMEERPDVTQHLDEEYCLTEISMCAEHLHNFDHGYSSPDVSTLIILCPFYLKFTCYISRK